MFFPLKFSWILNLFRLESSEPLEFPVFMRKTNGSEFATTLAEQPMFRAPHKEE
jgi:hypothetical protein